MVTGTMMSLHGMTMTGIRSGLIRLVSGLVTGLGLMTTGAIGPVIGLGTRKSGGMPNSQIPLLHAVLRVMSAGRREE